jgi:FtsP/CotA-like multicopper oxidase with cupredoxin domain
MGAGNGGVSTVAGVPQLPEGLPLAAAASLGNSSGTADMFEATLRAGPAQLAFLTDRTTEALAYNGASPGPTIAVTEGDRVRIRFENRIPGQPSTVHWHGLPVPADQDGNPMDPVASGADRVYEFTLPDGCAGSYWYHPHPHLYTAEQVARGLAGAFIVRPKSDPLPAGLDDRVLMFTDLRIDAAGRMMGWTSDDIMNGRMGDHVLVNGRRNPVLAAAPGVTLRLRLFNATNARFLRLAFDGLPMTLVGTDGGLLGAPLAGLAELLLTPGERAEVVMQLPQTAGTQIALRMLPYDRGWMMGSMPALNQSAVLTLRTDGAPRAPVALPATLRPIAPLPLPVAFKRLGLTETRGMMGGVGMMPGGMVGAQFLIDGRPFDMNRVDWTSPLGQVEQWEFVNRSSMDHPMHIHGAQFQVIETEGGGVRTPAAYLGWKDTVNVPQGDTVRLRVRFDTPGMRMVHCHILEHESQGMMGVLRVQ